MTGLLLARGDRVAGTVRANGLEDVQAPRWRIFSSAALSTPRRSDLTSPRLSLIAEDLDSTTLLVGAVDRNIAAAAELLASASILPARIATAFRENREKIMQAARFRATSMSFGAPRADG
jgi:hypothetical protein